MEQAEIEVEPTETEKKNRAKLAVTYDALLDLCGPTKDKYEKADTAHEICMVCMAADPRINFYLKLFGLGTAFNEKVGAAPLPCTPESAQDYLAECFSFVKQEAALITEADLAGRAAIAVDCYGTHFPSKLINTSAQGAVLLGSQASPTKLPHVSSRVLRARGIHIPLDQAGNDTTGVYQRLVCIAEAKPLPDGHELSADVLANVCNSVKQALDFPHNRVPDFVDHRLRQVLLPTDQGDYIAVSPMTSAGLSSTFHQAAAKLDAVLLEADPEAYSRFRHLTFQTGGANVQNASLFPANIVQRPFYFTGPTRRGEPELRRAFGFLHRSVGLFLQDKQRAYYENYLNKQAVAIRESAAPFAVKVEAAGALRAIVATQYHQLVALGSALAELKVNDDGDKVGVDEELLRRMRKTAPSDLDICLVNQNLGSEFVTAFSATLTDTLFAKVRDAHKLPLSVVDQERIAKAIPLILKGSL